VIELLPESRFCLLGEPAELSTLAGPRVQARDFSAGVYSALEQPGLFARTPGDTRVFWAPHVNLPLAARGRLLVTVHDAFYVRPPREARPRLDKALYLGALMRALKRRATVVACVSEFTKSELERLLGPFAAPLEVVPNGIERSWFTRPDAPSPHARPYLLFVGNLKPHKNLARTLTAFSRIAAQVPHDFLIAGGGDIDALRSGVAPELLHRIRFLGVLETDALKVAVAHAAGLVLASLYEGFGLPPLEAMALAVPVLVSRSASLPEVCGEAALYCDAESVDDIARGLEVLLTDEPTRARLAALGPERAQGFDWDRSARRMGDLVSGLLERS
jgi:glycosyltransferase involved in cell wall biosynthesis